MAGHRPFSELIKKMGPERAARVKTLAVEEQRKMFLMELRELMEMLGEPESKRAQLLIGELRDLVDAGSATTYRGYDTQIGVLRGIVEGLGGELEIIARLPDGDITVTPRQKRSGAA